MTDVNGERILIIDGSEDFIFSAGEYLRQKGFDVDLAFNLDQAESLIAEYSYDLILLDISLLEPTNKGLTFIQSLKQTNLKLDIIIVTGYATVDSALQSIKNGVSDYLVKPVRFEDLFDSIRRALNKRAQISKMNAKEKAAITHYLSTTLSHEINNPLTAILGYAQFLLNMDDIPHEARDIVRIIERQARRIKEITHRLHDLRKVDLVEYVSGTKMLDIKKDSSESKSSFPPDVSDKTILIVDDEKIVRDLLQDILEEKGFRTLAAKDGEEALELYRNHTFDLVFLDLKLPGMSGLDVLRHLKSKYSNVQIVVITGYLDDKQAAQAISDGALGCIFKPFQIKEILNLVQAVFSEQGVIEIDSSR